MTATDDYGEALRLLGRVERPPGESGYIGARADQLVALDLLLGYPAPSSVIEWLSLCNGAYAGPGGLYGVALDDEFLDIGSHFEMYPAWKAAKWIPMAGDGFNNHYVVDASRSHLATDGVFFVDTFDDPRALAYVVASTLPRFIEFLLERDLGTRGWPFDEGFVLNRDPDIESAVPAGIIPWIGR